MSNLSTNIFLLILGIGLFSWGYYSIKKDKEESNGIPLNFGTNSGLVIFGVVLILVESIELIACLLEYLQN